METNDLPLVMKPRHTPNPFLETFTDTVQAALDSPHPALHLDSPPTPTSAGGSVWRGVRKRRRGRAVRPASVDRQPEDRPADSYSPETRRGDDPMRLGISRRVVADDGAYVRGGTP